MATPCCWRGLLIRFSVSLFFAVSLILPAASRVRLIAQPAPAAPTTPPTLVDLSERLAQIEPLLPLTHLGMELAPTLPTLVGMNSPQNYLLVVQNSDELRATGGFISALGVVTLDKGRLGEIQFIDSYNLFRLDVEYPPPPPPMQQFMGIPYLLFRDANWSPDLPTTAQLLISMYRQETGVELSGVVTVDLHAVELLIGALAPLSIANVAEPLTGANVLNQIKQLWAAPTDGVALTASVSDTVSMEWWVQRKSFIPALAAAVMTKARDPQTDYVRLAQAVQTALDERSIQIWLKDPAAAAQIAMLGWDGSLQPQPAADFLALVDTNLGYNKANAVIQRQLAYTVTWPDGATAPPLATATITYTHPLNLPGHICDLTPRYGDDYNHLVERCFYNYLRLYTPAGSELVSLTGVQPDSVKATRGEHRTQVFGGYFILPPDETQVVQVQYRLPAHWTPETYALVVQRQAGSGPLPLTLTIDQQSTSLTVTRGKLYWTGAK
ncbi:MAG: DUF4012 domain-containing protein [Caldilineaceae bacterium]